MSSSAETGGSASSPRPSPPRGRGKRCGNIQHPMNSYLMLGTELGIPALLCFVVYVGLQLGGNKKLKSETLKAERGIRKAETLPQIGNQKSGTGNDLLDCSAVIPTAGCGGASRSVATPGGTPGEPADETSALRLACRAGAIVLLVAFWFDGGLFDLPTAAVFWVLLELGSARGGKVDSRELIVDRPKTT